MSRPRAAGNTPDIIVLHGIRTSRLGQGEAVRRYIKQCLEDNPGYELATTVSVLEVELERISENAD